MTMILKDRIADDMSILIPVGAEILAVQVQRGMPCIWYKCDENSPKERRRILIYCTGEPITESNLRYIGTYQLYGGDYVAHVFEQIKSVTDEVGA